MIVHFFPGAERRRDYTSPCGRRGWFDRSGEYDTADGSRIAGTTDPDAVTCKRCRRSLTAPA